MPKRIDVPGHGIIEFPDDMSDDQISQAIQNNILKQAPSKEPTAKPKEEPKSEGWQNFWRGIREGVQAGAQAPTTTPFQRGMAGFMGGLLGGTAKQAGAVGELVTPSAKPATDVGRELIKIGEETSKPGSVVGEIGSYVAPYTAATKLVQGAAAIPKAVGMARAGQMVAPTIAPAATTLGRAGQAAAAGGLTGYATTPGETYERAIGGALGAAGGALGETVLPYAYGVAKGLVKPGEYRIPINELPAKAEPIFPTAYQPLPGYAGEALGADIRYSLRHPLKALGGLAGDIGAYMGWKQAGTPMTGRLSGEGLASIMRLGQPEGAYYLNPFRTLTDLFNSNALQGQLGKGWTPGVSRLFTQESGAPITPPPTRGVAESLTGKYETPIQTAANSAPLNANVSGFTEQVKKAVGTPPQLPPPVYAVNAAGKVVQPGPRNVVIEGERMTLPENLNMSAVQSARPMQAQAAGPVQPTTLPTPTRTPKVVEGGVTAEERAKFDAMIKQAGGQPTAVAAADPYVALEQQLAARGLAPDVMKNTAINTRAKQIMDEAKANKIVISKKDATTQATVEYEKRSANLKKEEAAKKQEERAAREQAAKQAEETRLAEEKAAREAYEASPEGQAARAKAEADALAEQEKKRKAEEMRAQIRARTATPNEPPVAGPVQPTVTKTPKVVEELSAEEKARRQKTVDLINELRSKSGQTPLASKTEQPSTGMAALEEKISPKAPKFEDETSLVDMSRRQAIKEKMAANPVEIPESKPKATPSAAKSFDVKSWVTSSQKDGKRALDSHVLDDIEAQTGVKIGKKDIGDISSMTSKELKSHMAKVYDRMRKRQGK